ncbi:hypothetical protein H9P43_001892 [Blastocladiella emersonii ATCC 22665]|nr:hypothetical protein H9P43_001892 [Blastocladiella emersonii ATCC 22665]
MSASSSSSPTKERRLSQEARVGDFKLGKTIGQGAFSKVKLGFHKDTGQKVAIKIVDKVLMAEKIQKSAKRKEKMKSEKKDKDKQAAAAAAADAAPGSPPAPAPLHRDDSIPVISPISSPLPDKNTATSLMDTLYAEVKLLMRLAHPNIIGLYQVIDSEEECFIIMEYAPGGELIDYIAAKDYLSEKEARRFFRQIISAIDHCHQANVVHRDLKLENLLLSGGRDILITDFGLGRTFRSDFEDLMMTFCGTPNYAAVELISFKPYIGVHTDIWALGVILFIMCSGKPPFHGHSIPSLYNKIMNLQYTCPDHFSPELRHLLSRILVKEPSQRISMADMFADPWVNYEEIERPLRVSPLYDTLRETGMDQIMSINKDAACTTFSFARYQADILSYVVPPNRRGSAYEEDLPATQGGTTLTRRMSFTVGRRLSIARPTTPGIADPKSPGTAAASATTRRMSLAATATSPRPITPLGAITESAAPGGARHVAGTVGRQTTASPTQAAAGGSGAGSPAMATSRSMDFRRGRRSSFQGYANTSNTGAGGASPTFQRSATPTPVATGSVSGNASPALSPRPLDPFNEATRVLPHVPGVATGSAELMPGMPVPVGTGGRSINGSTTGFSAPTSPRRLSLVPKGDSILYNISSTAAASDAAASPGVGGSGAVNMDLEGTPLHEPSDAAIAEFHMLHRPPRTIRSIRFSLTSTNTSSMPPSAVFQELHRGLLLLQAQFPGLSFSRDPEFYLFHCRVPAQSAAATTSSFVGPAAPTSPGAAAAVVNTLSGSVMPEGPANASSSTGHGASTGHHGDGLSPLPSTTANSTTATTARAADVVFEAEVCKVWLLHLHGVRVKRISGDPLVFKDLYKDLVSKLIL